MKKNKIPYNVLIIIGVLTLFSFTGNKTHKQSSSFDASIYYHGYCEQFIGNNFNVLGDCRDNGLSQAYGFNFINWNSFPNSAFTGTGSYIARIDYSSSDFTTVAGLLATLSVYYWTHDNSLPSNGTIFWVVAGKSIIIYRTASRY